MKLLISLYLSIHPLWRMACDTKMKHWWLWSKYNYQH